MTGPLLLVVVLLGVVAWVIGSVAVAIFLGRAIGLSNDRAPRPGDGEQPAR